MHGRLVQTTELHYNAAARKRPGSPSAAYSEAHRHARTAGSFLMPHPGAPKLVPVDLAYDARRVLCHVPGYSPPRGRLLRSVGIAPTTEDSTFALGPPLKALH